MPELAAAEQQCCPFPDFRFHLTSPHLHLEVRASAGGTELLADLTAPFPVPPIRPAPESLPWSSPAPSLCSSSSRLFEIGGAWLVWQGIRGHKGWSRIGAGVIALALCATSPEFP